MSKIIGVRFRNTGKTYFFDPGQYEVTKDDHVIVETAKGIEYGLVVSGPQEVEQEKIAWPLKPVLRKASPRDDEQVKENEAKEKEAFTVCQEKIAEHGLDMKLTEVEYAFDNSKILFYFTADGRVDFRELVKDLAAVFRTRIELRQIGVRDEARAIGGYGGCGRPLCCATYLNDFAPVSIKMAKEQNLSLNPTKISGVCGRLMCCLQNEEEVYEVLNRTMPALGDTVSTNDGLTGTVQGINVLRQVAKVLVEIGDDKELREYKADEFRGIGRRKGRKRGNQMAVTEIETETGETEAELNAELRALEKEDGGSGERADRGQKQRDRGRDRRDRQRQGEGRNGEGRNGEDRQRSGEGRTGEGRSGEGRQRREDRQGGRRGNDGAAREERGAEAGNARGGQGGNTPGGNPQAGNGQPENGQRRRSRHHRGGRGKHPNGNGEAPKE